jgi:hypothetical protein
MEKRAVTSVLAGPRQNIGRKGKVRVRTYLTIAALVLGLTPWIATSSQAATPFNLSNIVGVFSAQSQGSVEGFSTASSSVFSFDGRGNFSRQGNLLIPEEGNCSYTESGRYEVQSSGIGELIGTFTGTGGCSGMTGGEAVFVVNGNGLIDLSEEVEGVVFSTVLNQEVPLLP